MKREPEMNEEIMWQSELARRRSELGDDVSRLRWLLGMCFIDDDGRVCFYEGTMKALMDFVGKYYLGGFGDGSTD